MSQRGRYALLPATRRIRAASVRSPGRTAREGRTIRTLVETDMSGGSSARYDAAFLQGALLSLLEGTTAVPASELTRVVNVAGKVLGAEHARVLVADYALVSLQQLGEDGPTGDAQSIEGTLAGRAFVRDEVVVSGSEPTLVWVPLSEGSERLGVLELSYDSWSDDVRAVLAPVVRVLVLVLISKRRYTDAVLRARRHEPLSIAAELQWDLLPPLTCSTDRASLSGILEPAYSIGGDSFDYAMNRERADFAIVDAVGHGMSAVMMSVAAINSLRNARRDSIGLQVAYENTAAPASLGRGLRRHSPSGQGWHHIFPELSDQQTGDAEHRCRP